MADGDGTPFIRRTPGTELAPIADIICWVAWEYFLKLPKYWYEWRLYGRGKTLFFEMLYRSGLLGIFRFFRRNSLLVLTYHDVLPPGFHENNFLFGETVTTDEFEWQLDFILRHYNPVSFSQLLEWLDGKGHLPPRAVLLTFDDGHVNNLQYALPRLKQRGIPFACFIVTAPLGERKLLWFEEGYYRLFFSDAKVWRLQNGEQVQLETTKQKALACATFFTMFRGLSEAEQEREIQSLRCQLALQESVGCIPGRFEFLDAADLLALRANGGEIGAHTMTHPILASLSTKSAVDEIERSKSRLEDALGAPVKAFAYPFGMPQLDFSTRDRESVQKAGFAAAFAANSGFVTAASDRFALPRFNIGRMSRAHFATTISGALDFIKSLAGLNN
jgi:peptidoglycan/xylan/chitin deacetylase (PgdA/CDA1 family)